MIENCTIYLPTSDVNLQSVFPGGTSDAAPANRPTRYEYETPQGPVRLNLKYSADDASHLAGLRGYIGQLDNSSVEISRAINLVNQVQMYFGVILPGPVSAESEAFQSLMFVTEQQQGFMFVADSILTAEGYLVGPMTYHPQSADVGESSTGASASQEAFESAPARLAKRRQQNTEELAKHGFVCADRLPQTRFEADDAVRPAEEVVRRLFAQMALFMWVAAPEKKATSDGLATFIAANNLDEALSAGERDILQMNRDDANAQHGAQIGWHLENMWALAWTCGFEPAPPFHGGQISGEHTRAVLEYLPNLGGTIDGFLQESPMRPAAEISDKEDLFFCAHNAVRSAQLGSETVPADFDPVVDGGAIHERRHALTWCLSPGTKWTDTDLST